MLRFATKLASPYGTLAIIVDDQQRLTQLHFVKDQRPGAAKLLVESLAPGAVWSAGQCEEAALQLKEYFEHQRKVFDLPLALHGSEFQQLAWAMMQAIPFGQVRTYGELARELGFPNGARAVGRACATNPVAIVVPCHRVVGSQGQLTGYAGGIGVKDALLVHEGVRAPLLFE